MKWKWFLPSIVFIFLLFICSSCEKTGSCTVSCYCDYGVFDETITYTPNGEFTKDECEENADLHEISFCSCSGEID